MSPHTLLAVAKAVWCAQLNLSALCLVQISWIFEKAHVCTAICTTPPTAVANSWAANTLRGGNFI